MSVLSKRLYLSLAIAVVVAVYALGNWAIKIQFQHPALNYMTVTVLVFSIPILLLASAWATPNRIVKVMLILLGVVCLVPATPVGLIASFETINILSSGKDGSFEKVAELTQGSRKLRLYVSNCGATCAYGMVLREELDMPIGLNVTRTVWSAYHTSEMATMQRISDRRVRVTQSDGATNEITF